MKPLKILSYCSTSLLGLVFLVSAFAKAWDADAFARMLLLYGPDWFSIAAPVIIFIESLLGMTLLLRFSPRWCAAAADIFLVTVSLILAYGMLALGVEDCGCFGLLSKLYVGPKWLPFVRNCIFLLISVPALLDKPVPVRFLYPKTIATLLVAAAASFVCGLAMQQSFQLPRLDSIHTDSRDETMAKLHQHYPFSPDSTYIVYLFSFSCPHCQDSYANVEQFQQMQIVDHVIGIAVEDSAACERFYRIYQPQIDILTIPMDQMTDITGSLPVCLRISGDSIKGAQSGSVTSPGIFLP